MTINTQKLRDGPYLRDGKETMRIMNEAADALDAQTAEIARLRDALETIAVYPHARDQEMSTAAMRKIARAALAQEQGGSDANRDR